MNHQTKNIAIIGAGIVGLYLAWKLSGAGYKVTVFEKKEGVGKEVCSGLFSERILGFIPESKKLVQNQITSVLIHFPKKTINVKFSKKILVMDHAKLDRLVANLAKKEGAEIILNRNVTLADIVALQDKFDKIIGCDGASSIVRKSLDLPEPSYRLGIIGFVPQADSSSYVETWPVENGFIWKIPRGGKIEYGVITKPNSAKKLFEEFLKKNKLSLGKISSAVIPQRFLIPKNNSITLCGEAAGLAKPWSGGGVIWGLIAAKILLKNFPNFLKYQKAMKKIFLPKIIFSKLATKVVYFLGFKIPWLLPKNIKIESDFLI